MKSKDVVYRNILKVLIPLEEELERIEAEIKLMWEFNHNAEDDHIRENKMDARAVILRREIAWWESELEEVA